MRATLKRLLKMVVGYGAVQWAGPLISFIFTPILTRLLTPSDYGIADYVQTIASGVGTVALFALPSALMTHFNDRPDDLAWRRHLTGSALALAILIGVPSSLALIFLAPQISQASFQDQRYTLLFQIIGAGLVFGLANAVLIASAQAALRVRWGMAFSLITIAVTVVGNIVLIIVLRLGVLGMLLVPTIAGMVLSIFAVLMMRRAIAVPQRASMQLLLRAGALLLPAMIAAWMLQMTDRLFLVHYVSTQELGYYAIANRVAALLFVLMAPLYSAWTPLALSMQHDPNARQRYANVARYLLVIVLLGALGLGLFATEILIVWTHAPYLPAAPYVGFLALVHVASACGTILTTGAMIGKQLAAISWTVLAGATLNLLLNFMLIPTWGLWGATIATILGYALQPALLYPLAQRRYAIPYPIPKLLAAMAIQLIILTLGTLLPPMYFPIRVTLKILLFAILPISFILLGLITRFELEQSWLLARHRLQLAWARVSGG